MPQGIKVLLTVLLFMVISNLVRYYMAGDALFSWWLLLIPLVLYPLLVFVGCTLWGYGAYQTFKNFLGKRE